VLDSLSAGAILEGLDTQFVGRHPVYLAHVGSTNDEARRLARAGAPEGTLVVADHQTAGRGRLDRRWEAPPGTSLLLSLLFRPPLAPQQVQQLTMVCGLAAVDAIEAQTGLQAGLKWPNDVLVGESKVGGILTEVILAGQQVDYAVVGIGLNVNLDPGRLPDDLLAAATSLARQLGRPVPRLPLLWALLRAVESRYLALKGGRSPQAEWAARLVTLGRPVTVTAAARPAPLAAGLAPAPLATGPHDRPPVVEGVAEGVDANGALLVRLADGRLETVMAGDVTLRTHPAIASG
jgi:BirA family biotin operon repressor/biotin-[acetyl-CoA-carboxylase] ligase